MNFKLLGSFLIVLKEKIANKVIFFCEVVFRKRNSIEVLFIANAYIPTLSIYFTRVIGSEVSYSVLTEVDLKHTFEWLFKTKLGLAYWLFLIKKRNPKVIIFCRYSGVHAKELLEYAKQHSIATIYQIDDDLLNVPIEFGEKKYNFHHSPARLSAVKKLLNGVDLVYSANSRLTERLISYGFQSNFYTGSIAASGQIYNLPQKLSSKKIGYMGFDHAQDFAFVVPAIVRVLKEFPEVTFELFGTIPKPVELHEFGGRVVVHAPLNNYKKFIQKFSKMNWSIAICPLADTPFNSVKSNIKWVEYTSVGAAVIATKGTVYNDCCENDCGVLTERNGWYDAMLDLLRNDIKRYTLVKNAQEKIINDYNDGILKAQIFTGLNAAYKARSSV